MSWYGGWAPYVSVAERRRRAQREMEKLAKKGVCIQPVKIEGRKIAKNFWGEGWCEHLESFSDFENRLPRGRTYVRNGSVCHLAINKGRIEAKVSGSELYNVKVDIKTLPPKKWSAIKKRCGGQIGSLLELLQGKLSDQVMGIVTDRQEGLFPLPKEISFRCSCPDIASMCKHIAAVLYGVGARLDDKPELLFALRGVDHRELIEGDAEQAVVAATSRGKSKRLASAEIADVFGIDVDEGDAPEEEELEAAPSRRPAKKKAVKKGVKKSPVKRSRAGVSPRKTAKKKTAKAPSARQA